MATFDGFDGLVVCDKCREDIETRHRHVAIEDKGRTHNYHADCAPNTRPISDISKLLDRWVPFPL